MWEVVGGGADLHHLGLGRQGPRTEAQLINQDKGRNPGEGDAEYYGDYHHHHQAT
jgi:hypothetical protein